MISPQNLRQKFSANGCNVGYPGTTAPQNFHSLAFWTSFALTGFSRGIHDWFGLFVRRKQGFQACAQGRVALAFAPKECSAFLDRLGRRQDEQGLFALVGWVHEWFRVAALTLHA
jgi:hypothetical protein